MKTDVLILGAGASGLAAAREFQKANVSCLVLEARDRIGGRVLTQDRAELGAEFVHGTSPAFHSILRKAKLTLEKAVESDWNVNEGRQREITDFWDRLGKILSLTKERKRDRSFSKFLKDEAPPDAELAFAFVEGFHAADADRISEQSLAEDDESNTSEVAHAREGYGKLVDWLSKDLTPILRLRTPVKSVHWKKGSVVAKTPRGKFEAKALISTLPLSLWKKNVVKFHPPLTEKKSALAKLEMGSAVRVVFHLRKKLWKPGKGSLQFFHTNDRDFQTWWTWKSARPTTLTAWSGGPLARELSHRGRVVDRAVRCLSEVFGLTLKEVRREILAAHFHDWESDPYSLGAYSYTGVGGEGARDRLAKPIKNTLFFAGEATDAADFSTVQGALHSGERAAKECLEFFRS